MNIHVYLVLHTYQEECRLNEDHIFISDGITSCPWPSRAQECLYISYHTDSSCLPSRFLIDVQEFCNEYEWRSGELRVIE